MKLTTAALLVAIAGAFAAPAALAAETAPAGNGAVAGACRADVEKLCPGVQPGEHRIVACLKEHKKEVSKECKSAIMKARRAKKGAEAG